MQLDDTICYCFHVSKRKILNYLRVHRPRRATGLSECGGAGTGCGWCVATLRRYFAEFSAGTEAVDEVAPDDYARARGAYLRSGRGQAPPGAIPPPTDSPPRNPG